MLTFSQFVISTFWSSGGLLTVAYVARLMKGLSVLAIPTPAQHAGSCCLHCPFGLPAIIQALAMCASIEQKDYEKKWRSVLDVLLSVVVRADTEAGMMSTYRARTPEELGGQHDGCKISQAQSEQCLLNADRAAESQ